MMIDKHGCMLTSNFLNLTSPISSPISSPRGSSSTPIRCGRVDSNQLVLGHLVGRGGFGSVYVASLRGRKVAVKMYTKSGGSRRVSRQSFEAELMVYRMGIKHTNIISILGATSLQAFHDDSAWIIMDYGGTKNLQCVLSHEDNDIDHVTRLSFSLQIARGLSYLHSFNLMHLDLKPANCLLSQNMRLLRIADFGCCQHIHPVTTCPKKVNFDDNTTGSNAKQDILTNQGLSPNRFDVRPEQSPNRLQQRNQLAGTLVYRAPELLRGQKPQTSADVYSMGITLWQMRTRKGPYEGVPAEAVVYQVVSRNLRPRKPSDDFNSPFEVLFSDLYTQCWSCCENTRPTCHEVVQAVSLWMDNM